MASAGECIREKGRRGEIDPELANELGDQVDDLVESFRRAGDPDAETSAAVKVRDQQRWKAAVRRNMRRRQAAVQKEVLDEVNSVPEGKERTAFALATLFPRPGGRQPRRSIWAQQQLHQQLAYARMSEAVEGLRPKKAGLTYDRELEEDIIRVLHGEEPRNRPDAKEIAEGVRRAFDYHPEQFRRMGIPVARRDKWTPQQHSSVKTGEADPDTWVKFMMDRADREQMINRDTGEPFTDEELERTLRKMHEAIRKDTGDNRSFLEKLTRERFFIFRDSDGYLEWREKYGADDSFMDSVHSHIENTSLNLARVEAFGPFPDQTARKITEALGPRQTVGGIPFDGLYKHMTGQTSIATGNQGNTAPRFLAGARHVVGSSILGSASILAVNDIAFSSAALRTLGVQSPFFRSTFNVVKRTLNPNKERDRILARKYGFVLESHLARTQASQRFEADEAFAGLPHRMQDTVLRATGLTAITENVRRTNYELSLRWMTEHKARSFDELPAQLRKTFNDFRIDSRQWDVIRTSIVKRGEGFEFIDPETVVDTDREAGENMMRLVNRIMEAGSPRTDPETRFLVTLNGTDADTIGGQLARMVTQLAFWPVGIMRNQTRVIAGLGGEMGTMNAFKKTAISMISLYAMAVPIVQLRDVVDGKVPRSPDNPSLIREAVFASGMFGLGGDFIQSFLGLGFSRGLEDFAVPPTVSPFASAGRAVSQVGRAVAGDPDANPGRALVRAAEDFTPGSTAWFAQLFLERMIFDTVQQMADPDAHRAFRAESRYAEDEEGTRYFVEPGEGLFGDR